MRDAVDFVCERVVNADLKWRIGENVIIAREENVRISRCGVKSAGDLPALGRTDGDLNRCIA